VPFGVLIVLLAVGGVALLLALNTASAANELRRHDLATKDTSVAANLQQVHNQVAASAAPGNLGRAARALGMVAAENPAFVVLEPDGSVRELGSPGAALGPAPIQAPATPKPSKAKPKPSKTSAKPSKAPKSKSKSKSKAHGHGAATPSPHPTPTKPTPTPTPTVTLPGGNR
jgi:hypothetical protein